MAAFEINFTDGVGSQSEIAGFLSSLSTEQRDGEAARLRSKGMSNCQIDTLMNFNQPAVDLPVAV